MKSRVLGLACAAGLAAGCQSSAARALSRYQATKDKADDVAQVSHAEPAGLPGASKRRTEATSQSPEVAYEAGEKALQQFYRDKHDKPIHLQRARVNFEAAAKADPTFSAAQHRLAIVADLQERYHESESYYRTALSLDPQNANIAADLGWSYMLQERWSDAERALQRALELDPNATVAREHLAQCRQQQSSMHLASSERSQPGQMLANRPASVGPGPATASQRWDDRGVPQANQWGSTPVPPDHMGEYLRNQLSQVDRYGTSQSGQPLTLGPQPSQPTHYGQAPQQGAAPLAQAQSPAQYQSPSQYQSPAQYPHGPDTGVSIQPAPTAQYPAGAYAARPEPQTPPPYFTHIEPGSQAPQRGPAQMQQRPLSPHANVAGGGQLPRGAGLEWPSQPSGRDMIQRTQAIDGPGMPDQAMYQSPQLPVLPAPAGMPESAPIPNGYAQSAPPQGGTSNAPPLGFGQPQEQSPPIARQEPSALEKARRDAALMGLGVGPGQLLPTLEQTPDRVSAGSFSQVNGAGFAAPPVRSPDLTPPPDLRQSPSFFEQPPMAPPTNSMGQAMPAATSNMMTPGSATDPNARFQQRFDAPVNAPPQMTAPPSNVWNQGGQQSGLQGYDDSRRVVDQQLQQTLQTTWAGTPSGAIPSPANGVPVQGPAAPSQMMHESWARQPIAPAPYSQAPPVQQASRSYESNMLPVVNPSSSKMPAGQADPYPPAGRMARPVYREGVVVPDQYGRP